MKPVKKAAEKAAPKKEGYQIYAKKLNEMRDDLTKVVHHTQEDTELSDLEVGDEADVATQSSERELMFELSDNERQMLDAIEAALRKIDTGRYGMCDSCSKKIPRERLKVIPHARYCVACQSRFERPR